MEQSESKTETKPKDYCVRYLFYSFISTVSVAAVSCAVSSTFWTVLPRYLLASNIVSLLISFYFSYIGVSKLRVFTTTRVNDVDKMSFFVHKDGNRFALSLYVMHCCLLSLIMCITVGAGPETTVFIVYAVSCAAHSVHWRASLVGGNYHFFQQFLYLTTIVLSALELIFFVPSSDLLKGSVLTFSALVIIVLCLFICVRSGYLALPLVGIPLTARKVLLPVLLICLHSTAIEADHMVLTTYPDIVINLFILFTSFNDILSVFGSLICFAFLIAQVGGFIDLFPPEPVTIEELEQNASF